MAIDQSGLLTPSERAQSMEEEEVPPHSDRPPVDPFIDPPRRSPQRFERPVTTTSRSPEVRTLASDHSILETPVNVFAAPELQGYRISPETAQVFEAHARRMEMEDSWANYGPPDWTRRLSQRRSSTDLRRMKVVK